MGKPGRLWAPRGDVRPGAFGEEVFPLGTCCLSVAVLGPFGELSPPRSTPSVSRPVDDRGTS